MKKLILSLMVSVAVAQVQAADCNTSSIVPTTPIVQFIDHGNGTILDLKTGLLWSKCSLGQTYEGDTCTGAATTYTTFSEGLTAAHQVKDSHLDTNGWRVPNIKELDSIVERQCTDPSINVPLFPDTPSATYISSTPDPDSLDGTGARSISFFTGEEYTPPTEPSRHIRLVKDSR